VVERAQARGADWPPLPAQLACLAQDFMEDHALHRLRALRHRQTLDVAVPVLARTVAIGGDGAERELDVAVVAVDRDDGGDRRGRRDLSFADGTARRCPQLIQEARRAPPSPAL